MVNESEIPQFRNGYLQPSGIVSSKQAGPLTKAIMSRFKTKTKTPQIRKPGNKRTGRTRGIKADDKVHFIKSGSAHSQYF